MTREEMIELTEFIAIACPQQKINRATAIAWFEIIGHLDFHVARAAVIAVKHQQAFVDPSDIIAEAERARHRHPSERTVAEALGRTAVPAIGAGRTDPTPEYTAAKDQMEAKLKERAQAVQFTGREAARRAELWISYKLSGKLPPALPLSGEPAPQWQPLPGDPPELLAWLARQQAGPN